jgi:TonB-linked SusC/RagA family outer membrane protein
MKKHYLIVWSLLCLILCLSPTDLASQDPNIRATTIRGIVGDSTLKQALVGARVSLRGTLRGTVTDGQGKFTLQVPSDGVLEVSYIGYKNTLISVKDVQTATQPSVENLRIFLAPDPSKIDAVVVTAIGIEKSEKSLGYAISEVQGADLTQARETNLAASLVGRVPGAQINMNAGAVGSSSRVILRGVKAIGAYQNNQPLYLVDGIPIDNSSGIQPQKYGGIDWGDGIQHINPDDIATISVLRGAAASALYGSRAQNGVILITTKKGAPSAGLGVEYNGNFVWDTPLLLPRLQNEYGHGYGGRSPATQDEALDAGTSSWGEKMNGQSVMFFDGVRRPLTPQPNNLRDFYQLGHAFTNTIALSGGNDAATMRFSASNLDNVGMIPNSFLNRTTLTLTATAALTDRFRLEAKANYISERSNRTPLADQANPGRTFMYMARSLSTSMLKNYRLSGSEIQNYTYDAYNPNPYFLTDEHFSRQTVERLIANVLARYQVSDELSLQVRAGRDANLRRFQSIEGIGTPYNPPGFMYEGRTNTQEINADALLTYTKALSEQTNLTLTAGGNFMEQTMEGDYVYAYEFILPGFLNVANTKGRDTYYDLLRKRVLSVYGAAQFSFQNWLFVEATARNDWSSTLPTANNSYFYPSVNTSIVLSDLMRLPEAFSFAKLRASWAQVGSDTDPYKLSETYVVDITANQRRGNVIIARGSSFVIPLSALRPTRSNTVEIGADVRLFDGRLGVDVTWYSQNIFDQILPTDVSFTTGFRQAVINAGEMQNSGIEVLLTATPVRGEIPTDFRWDMSLNLARNWNSVVALSPGLTTLLLEEGRFRANVVARVDEPYGVIEGAAFRRDAAGRVVHNADGFPLIDDSPKALGNSTPQILGGFTNTFSWQNLTLSALVDFRFGGQMFSNSNAVQYEVGTHEATVRGRESGIVSEGVLENGQPNTKNLPAFRYYRAFAQAAEPFLYDASFVKLREVRLGYTLSPTMLQGTFLSGIVRRASLALVARNVLFLLNNVPGVDPQTGYTNANGQGLEMGGYPTPRSLGFNINLTF